jgi:hypothetical protein
MEYLAVALVVETGFSCMVKRVQHVDGTTISPAIISTTMSKAVSS